jgi:hypothetical protein
LYLRRDAISGSTRSPRATLFALRASSAGLPDAIGLVVFRAPVTGPAIVILLIRITHNAVAPASISSVVICTGLTGPAIGVDFPERTGEAIASLTIGGLVHAAGIAALTIP